MLRPAGARDRHCVTAGGPSVTAGVPVTVVTVTAVTRPSLGIGALRLIEPGRTQLSDWDCALNLQSTLRVWVPGLGGVQPGELDSNDAPAVPLIRRAAKHSMLMSRS